MTTLRAIGALPGAVPVAGERLRAGGPTRLLLAFAVVWMVFVVTGFRPPWTPIDDLADGSRRRQIVFTIGALIALWAMVRTYSVGQIAAHHLGVAVLGAWMVGSVAWSSDAWLTLKRSTIFLFGFAFLLAVVHGHPRPVRWFLRVVVCTVGGLAWVSLAAAAVFPPECSSIELRPGLAGVSPHPNALGPCLQIGLTLSLGVARPRHALLHRVLQLGMLIALWRTDSVTSIVATLCGGTVFVLLSTRSYRSGLIQIGVVALLLVALAVGTTEVRDAFLHTADRDASLSGRDTLWSVVYAEGLRHPLFGTGYGAFWYPDRGWELTGTWNPRQSHHAYLDVFVELGVCGLLLVGATVLVGLWTGFRRCAGPRGSPRRRAVAAITATAVALCAISAFSESFYLRLDKFQFFVLLWAVMLLHNRDSNRVEAEFGADAAASHRHRRAIGPHEPP